MSYFGADRRSVVHSRTNIQTWQV
ncbi:MAG: hypothetical protein KJ070_10815 [Verrucomicrobia bacterium]|nr:hypothetical protein [Verrucomicrobiota bacterium]